MNSISSSPSNTNTDTGTTRCGWTMVTEENFNQIVHPRGKGVMVLRRHGHFWYKIFDPTEAYVGYSGDLMIFDDQIGKMGD